MKPVREIGRGRQSWQLNTNLVKQSTMEDFQPLCFKCTVNFSSLTSERHTSETRMGRLWIQAQWFPKYNSNTTINHGQTSAALSRIRLWKVIRYASWARTLTHTGWRHFLMLGHLTQRWLRPVRERRKTRCWWCSAYDWQCHKYFHFIYL